MNAFIKAARHVLRCRVKQAESLPLVGQERPKVSDAIPNSPGDVLNSYNLPGNDESVPITGKYFVPKGMNYLEPGVYAIDSGMLPFNWARNTGTNNYVRHSLAAFCIGMRQFLLLPNSTMTVSSVMSIILP